jgi:hypothetical protein
MMSRVKRLIATALLLSILAACSGGSSGAALVMAEALAPTVTLDTMEMVPGTFIHGEGVGVGGGDTCGAILEFDGYRTEQRVVFRIHDQNGFCFPTDIYEVAFDDVVWKGERGRMILGNNGDPRTFTNGFAFFIPESTGFGVFVDDLTVAQWMDDPADTWLFLSLPLNRFEFARSDEDMNSVFRVSAQIERVGEGVIDYTEPVNVDLVEPGVAP